MDSGQFRNPANESKFIRYSPPAKWILLFPISPGPTAQLVNPWDGSNITAMAAMLTRSLPHQLLIN